MNLNLSVEEPEASFTQDITSPSSYVLRPFFPSMSISQLDKSSFSCGGIMDLNQLISEMTLSESENQLASMNLAPEMTPSNYHQRAEEIKEQILKIRILYNKEVNQHEEERKEYEEAVKKLTEKRITNHKVNPYDFDTKHVNQMKSLQSILENVINLQNKISRII